MTTPLTILVCGENPAVAGELVTQRGPPSAAVMEEWPRSCSAPTATCP